ncbi:MAG: SGNH/GDSL hydrolase family protein [Solirubrobacteraceae bacterium]|jgi:lysophospholipase L1-like esterase
MKLMMTAATGLAICATLAAGAVPASARGSIRTARRGALARGTHAGHAAASSHFLPVRPGSRYLALGDSVTFGYEEPQVVPTPDYAKASSFANYPDMLGEELHLDVVNVACPGETTGSFIKPSAISNGCENTLGDTATAYRTLFPLHVSYSGSQLAYALSYLRLHPDVTLVSLMIGANDFFVCQETTSDGCASGSELQTTAAQVAANVRMILSAIRDRAHYVGQLVIVNYYSLDYASAAADAESNRINGTVDSAAQPFHVEIADGYGEFQAASAHSGDDSCTAGLLTQLGTPGDCGIHPSYAGQALLAQAVEDAIGF